VKTVVRTVVVFCVAALLAVSGQAQDKKNARKEAPRGERFARLFAFPSQIKLDEQQQSKLNALKKEYTPRLEELYAKYTKIMTPERQKAREAAIKAARAAGKKDKEISEAVNAALKLSKDEQAKMDDLVKAQRKLIGEVQQKKLALLTAEQKAQLKKQQ
jgi:hypothetical protein